MVAGTSPDMGSLRLRAVRETDLRAVVAAALRGRFDMRARLRLDREDLAAPASRVDVGAGSSRDRVLPLRVPLGALERAKLIASALRGRVIVLGRRRRGQTRQVDDALAGTIVHDD